MNRREALRLLAAGAMVPLAAPRLLALREARALVETAAGPGTLNAHQLATVKMMAEMILPRTDTPGATDVGATEFIDLILSEWYEDDERDAFLNGLGNVDARSQALFGKDFVECAVPQQSEILIELGEKMMEETDAMPGEKHLSRGSRPTLSKNSYAMLRRLTLTAYYTSEAGATAELHFEVIPGRFEGCQVPGEHGKEESSPQ
jgi:gluconate 2-dehydrogenase gamma chain